MIPGPCPEAITSAPPSAGTESPSTNRLASPIHDSRSSLTFRPVAVSNWLIAGLRPQPLGNENMTASPSGTFRTGEGLLNIAANKQEQFETLSGLIGRKDLIADARFAGREDRKRNRFELKREIENALVAKSAAQWAAVVCAYGLDIS